MRPLIPVGFALGVLAGLGCGPRPRTTPPIAVETPLETGPSEPAVDASVPDTQIPDAAVTPAVVGIVLPQEGPSARLGAQLAEVAVLIGAAGEDAPGVAPRLELRSAADPESAVAAIESLEAAGAFGVVGLFDQTTAPAAAEAAADRGLPTLMLTVSDAAVTSDGPVWRVLHTPLLVARTAAGAALARGAKRAVVVRPDTTYAGTLGGWFERVWSAGGGAMAGRVVWSKRPDWGDIAARVAALPADALFIPCGPTEAAQIASHLAAAGVWARRGSKPRFRNKTVREVWMLGPPEWYTPALPRQAGRYLEGALVPVPYAAETARGAPFSTRVREATGRRATAFDALFADAVDAVVLAHRRHPKGGGEAADSMRQVTLATPRTAGLGFATRDALVGLVVLGLTKDGFRPAP